MRMVYVEECEMVRVGFDPSHHFVLFTRIPTKHQYIFRDWSIFSANQLVSRDRNFSTFHTDDMFKGLRKQKNSSNRAILSPNEEIQSLNQVPIASINLHISLNNFI